MNIHSVAKGKRSELLMMAKLIENGFNVFQSLADIEGIDCGVLGKNNRFFPIQIKSRAEFTKGDLVSVSHFKKDMFIIIYDVKSNDFWIIPADEYKNISTTQKTEDGGLRYRLTVTKRNAERLNLYNGENGIQVLKSKITK